LDKPTASGRSTFLGSTVLWIRVQIVDDHQYVIGHKRPIAIHIKIGGRRRWGYRRIGEGAGTIGVDIVGEDEHILGTNDPVIVHVQWIDGILPVFYFAFAFSAPRNPAQGWNFTGVVMVLFPVLP